MKENDGVKKSRKRAWVYVLLIAFALLLTGVLWTSNKEEGGTMELINQFHSDNPTIEFPLEYDLKKNKKWDSGVEQWELKTSKKIYLIQIQDDKVIKFEDGTNNKQLYPVDSVAKETTFKEKVVDKVKSVFTPSESEDMTETKQEPMNKIEYTITISKLLGDVLINIENTEGLLKSTELDATRIEEASKLLEESIGLYEEVKNIVPPEDWEKLHQSILVSWETYIVGEEGLLNSMEEAWTSSEEERAKAMEVMKEKGKVTGEYSLEFGQLILEFLGELTGLSN